MLWIVVAHDQAAFLPVLSILALAELPSVNAAPALTRGMSWVAV